MTLISICIFLSIFTFSVAIAKQIPSVVILSVIGMVLTGIVYFDSRQSELEKALLVNVPIECKGAKYSDYVIKEGFIVVDSKAFKKYECSVIE